MLNAISLLRNLFTVSRVVSIGRAGQETVNDLSLGKSQVFATELRSSRTGTEL